MRRDSGDGTCSSTHLQVLAGDEAPFLGATGLEEALQFRSCLGGPGLGLWSHRGILAISRLSNLPPAAGAQFPAFSGHPLSRLHAALTWRPRVVRGTELQHSHCLLKSLPWPPVAPGENPPRVMQPCLAGPRLASLTSRPPAHPAQGLRPFCSLCLEYSSLSYLRVLIFFRSHANCPAFSDCYIKEPLEQGRFCLGLGGCCTGPSGVSLSEDQEPLVSCLSCCSSSPLPHTSPSGRGSLQSHLLLLSVLLHLQRSFLLNTTSLLFPHTQKGQELPVGGQAGRRDVPVLPSPAPPLAGRGVHSRLLSHFPLLGRRFLAPLFPFPQPPDFLIPSLSWCLFLPQLRVCLLQEAFYPQLQVGFSTPLSVAP